MKRVNLIVNPISGNGRGLRAAIRAQRAFARDGVEATILQTEAAGDGTRFARDTDAGVDAVLAVGGDGTLNEVISGLTRSVPVGIIPVGTANVVARDLGIPFSPERAVKAILSGVTRRIDVGTVNDRRFLAMVGIGFDGAVVKAICENRRGPISMATYVAPALRTLRDFRAPTLHVEIDGRREQLPHHGAIVTNTRNYGGLFSVTPSARPDDGILHWVGHRKPGRLPLLAYAAAALFRCETSASFATYGSGKSFVISSDEPCAVEADGDYVGMTPVRIGVLPGACNILAPPSRRA